MKDLIKFANDLNRLIEDNEILRRQVSELQQYKTKYDELLYESVKHGEKMMLNTLNILMTPDVTESFIKHNKDRKKEDKNDNQYTCNTNSNEPH